HESVRRDRHRVDTRSSAALTDTHTVLGEQGGEAVLPKLGLVVQVANLDDVVDRGEPSSRRVGDELNLSRPRGRRGGGTGLTGLADLPIGHVLRRHITGSERGSDHLIRGRGGGGLATPVRKIS